METQFTFAEPLTQWKKLYNIVNQDGAKMAGTLKFLKNGEKVLERIPGKVQALMSL